MAKWDTNCKHRMLATLVFVSLVASGGCVRVPRPVAPEVQGLGGTAVDPPQILPGQTTRAEVLRDWGWSDAASGDDRLFIGHLKFSNEKGLEINGPIIYPEGRRWSDMTLFVEFDLDGVVVKSYLTRDRIRAITSWVIANHDLPRLDLSQPIQMSTPISRGHGEHIWAEFGIVALASDSLELRSDRKKGDSVHIMLEQVQELRESDSTWYDRDGNPHMLYGQGLKMHGVDGWSSVQFALSPSDTVILVRYIKQVRESALPRGDATGGK